MAKIKLYRYPQRGTMCLQFSNGDGDNSRHSLPITLKANEWDGSSVTAAHPQRISTNAYLSTILSKAQLILVEIQEEESVRRWTARELRDAVVARLFANEEDKKPTSFEEAFTLFNNTHTNKRTREIYADTLKRVKEYDTRLLTCEMINRKWLDGFDRYLAERGESTNTRAIHFRNIRAVINYAIDTEVLDKYVFRRYKIKREETIHRDLTIEDIQMLFAYQPPTERANKHASKPLDYAVKYVDMAKLMFYLIGINPVDLFNAKPQDYYGGRIHYQRAKTHKPYDVKVEPEAAAIIRKYRGEKRLISLAENRDYRSLLKQTNKALKAICKEMGLPPATCYWMRHSWATIAYSLGASTDLIADCLGHQHGSRVTATYINKGRVFASKDELTRAVIDAVNG